MTQTTQTAKDDERVVLKAMLQLHSLVNTIRSIKAEGRLAPDVAARLEAIINA